MADFNFTEEQYADIIDRLGKVENHLHDGVNSLTVNYPNLTGRTRYIFVRALGPTTSLANATIVGGVFTMPFTGTFIRTATGSESIWANVDTAGVGSNSTFDVLINRASIFNVNVTPNYLTIPSTKTTSLAQTQPSIQTTGFSKGDLLSFDIKATPATPAQGLEFVLKVTETSK